MRDLLINLRSVEYKKQSRVAIYGAGEAGAQLAAALRLAGNHRIVCFLDDNPAYWRRQINGVVIQPSRELTHLSASIDQVLLPFPHYRVVNAAAQISLSRGISVLQVPSIDDLTQRANTDSLRSIAIEDLLGRDEVLPCPELLVPGIRDSVVCVTGAGGSIGSELCRQILALLPKRLILLDSSEPALYQIDSELRPSLPEGVLLQTVLGSATEFQPSPSLLIIMSRSYSCCRLQARPCRGQPLAGLANNVCSTHQVCRAAVASHVSQVVLISTDKAVRPTNVMGASKRLAELVVQAHAAESSSTRFSMVRFGNVLGSSGSVVPLFRRQIAAGGPITLTHPDIIRYFMTIPEAATLVLQSSGLAQGGDVFLLDMGEPVRIKDLAEQMVR